jgi:hypothetical protein
LLHQHFQLVKLSVAGCKIARQWRLVSKVELDQSQSKGYTVNGFQQLFTLILPFELSDTGFLGNLSQLAPGFVTLRLEMEVVALAVGHGGVVVQLRRVVWQGWIGRRRGRFHWMSLEQKRIIRNRNKIWKESQRELTITTSDESRRGFLPPRRWRGACYHYRHQVFGVY